MPIRDPHRAVLALLSLAPMSAQALADRLDRAAETIAALAGQGEIEQGRDGRWRLTR